MKNIFFRLLVLIPLIGIGQKQETLSEKLWSRVNNCYTMIQDMNDNDTPDFNIIDDSKNGYLKITGSWPTCGCSCSSTVGAYKNSKDELIFLQSNSVSCYWEKRISSNKDLKNIFPENFGINSFTSEQIDWEDEYAIFYLNVEIPRIGTDTKVRLELIPFGLAPQGENIICFEYKQEKPNKSLYGIRNIAIEISDKNTINYLLNGLFEKISSSDNLLISKEIGTDDSNFESIEEMQKYLLHLKSIYDLSCKLKVNELILGWNRTESRFFIKGTGEKLSQKSFLEFLIDNRYWGLVC